MWPLTCRHLRATSEFVLMPYGVVVEIRKCKRCGARSSREIFPGDPNYDPRQANIEVQLEEASGPIQAPTKAAPSEATFTKVFSL
jgi:hypothetical protein